MDKKELGPVREWGAIAYAWQKLCHLVLLQM